MGGRLPGIPLGGQSVANRLDREFYHITVLDAEGAAMGASVQMRLE